MLKLSSIAGKIDRHSVAAELDDLAALRFDQLNHAAEITIEQAREFFGSFGTLAGQRFGQWREAGDIGKQNRRRETFNLCFMRRRGFDGLQGGAAEAGRHVSSQCL